MKTFGIVIALTAVLGVASLAPASAALPVGEASHASAEMLAGPGGGCGMPGSWKGSTGETSFLATYSAVTSPLAGVADLDLWGDASFGGAFPAAVRMTSGRGTWAWVAPSTYDYQFLSIALDAANAVVYQLRVNGRKWISPDCHSTDFSVTISIYAPWQDAFGNEPPLFAGPFPGADGHSVRLPLPGR